MMKALKRKPCPFCGAMSTYLTLVHSDFGHGSFIKCTVCWAQGPARAPSVDARNVTEAWNRRKR